MSTPWLGPSSLDESGCPAWISAIAGPGRNRLVHVVRDLEPAAALAALGAKPDSIVSCELPSTQAGPRTSPPRAAGGHGNPLLSGRVGDWTFVYDDLGCTLAVWSGTDPWTARDAASILSATGNTAATGYLSAVGQAGFIYSIAGKPVVEQELYRPDELGESSPAEVRTAVRQAGAVNAPRDGYLGIRSACALAGLPGTLDGFGEVPLLTATVD
jgi:hypothetical protein